MSALQSLLRPEIFVFLIPISAILVGGAVAITKMVIRHRERMAMIEQGFHPGHLPDDEDTGDTAEGSADGLEQTQVHSRS